MPTKKEKDKFTRSWIIKNGVPIVKSYEGNLTLRALHYRLVSIGMFNTVQHYKRVIGAMTKARWDGLIEFDDLVDHDREMLGETKYDITDVDSEVEGSMNSIKYWLDVYRKNRWENQPIYAEVFIEKKALQGVFESPCSQLSIALNPCKGYASLTFIHDAYKRFSEAESRGKELIILYFGDYDPSGEDIPRSLIENLSRMGVDVKLKRIALNESQVIEWRLPPAPAKTGDSRTRNWDGLGQVELDAVEPRDLVKLLRKSVADIFDEKLFSTLQAQEKEEREEYKSKIGIEIREFLDL